MIYTDEKDIIVHKGKSITTSINKFSNVIAFDLDETLGCFVDLEILWRGLTILKLNNENQNNIFNELLDIYPDFLRYGIIQILEFLYQKKKKGFCDKIYIYTNNQCFSEWCKLIASYFDYKLNTDIPIFDQIISAFKIDNKIIEIGRTTNQKTFKDFIKCTLLPKKTKVCFVDNVYFPEMKHDRVYYIKPKSYYHHLSNKIIINRFFGSPLCKKLLKSESDLYMYNSIISEINFKNNIDLNSIPSKKELELDVIVAQKIMYHMKEFFYLTQKKFRTKKQKYPIGRFTRKKIFYL